MKDRELTRLATEAVLFHSAGVDIMAGGKGKGKGALDKAIKRMNNGG